jgi:hypothetical protein
MVLISQYSLYRWSVRMWHIVHQFTTKSCHILVPHPIQENQTTAPVNNTVSSAICPVILYKNYISGEVLICIFKIMSSERLHVTRHFTVRSIVTTTTTSEPPAVPLTTYYPS